MDLPRYCALMPPLWTLSSWMALGGGRTSSAFTPCLAFWITTAPLLPGSLTSTPLRVKLTLPQFLPPPMGGFAALP